MTTEGWKRSCSPWLVVKGKPYTVRIMAGEGRWEVQVQKSKELTKQRKSCGKPKENGSGLQRSSRVWLSFPTKAHRPRPSIVTLLLLLLLWPQVEGYIFEACTNSSKDFLQLCLPAAAAQLCQEMTVVRDQHRTDSCLPMILPQPDHWWHQGWAICPLAKSDPLCLLSSFHSESQYNLFFLFVYSMKCL